MDANQTDSEVAAVLADWVDGLEDSTRRHNSAALFLEKKLTGIEDKILQAKDPNRIRTACAIALFDEIIQRSRTLAPSLVAVRHDLLKSIYWERPLHVSNIVRRRA